jgi:hypothetical protein
MLSAVAQILVYCCHVPILHSGVTAVSSVRGMLCFLNFIKGKCTSIINVLL